MATIEKISSEEAQRRRSELLQAMHLNEEELRERARQYQLSADEMAVLDRLDELNFLLGR